MHVLLAALILLAAAGSMAATAAAQVPPPVQPGATPPATPTLAAREFSATTGMIFHTVRPERVADFEKVIAYLQAALEKATEPTIAAQARGWRVFKASEPGPNGTVLYVFLFDPAVPKAEYALGRILADAYPDPVQLQEIWKLYTSSVTSGGTLLNLTDSHPPLPPPPGAKPETPSVQPPPRTRPPDANPNVN